MTSQGEIDFQRCVIELTLSENWSQHKRKIRTFLASLTHCLSDWLEMFWCRNSMIGRSCTLFLFTGVTKVCLHFALCIYSASRFPATCSFLTFTKYPPPPPCSPAHQPTYFPPWPLALQPAAHLPLLLLHWDCVPYMSKPVLTGVWCQLICCSVDRPMAPPNCTRARVCVHICLYMHLRTWGVREEVGG